MAAWGAYADGIGGADWCWGWYMSAAMEMARPTMGAVKVRREAVFCSFSEQSKFSNSADSASPANSRNTKYVIRCEKKRKLYLAFFAGHLALATEASLQGSQKGPA